MAPPNDWAESLQVDTAAYSCNITYNRVLNVETSCYSESPNALGSSDSPHSNQWVRVADWHELAYQELTSLSIQCLWDLVNIEARVKGLLSQSSESADKYEPLKIFLEEYLKFLALSKDDLVLLSKNKCYMLMTLIESFVVHFEDSLSSYEYGKHLFSLSDLYQIPELQQQMIIKVLCTNPSLRSESAFSDSTRQSVWVRLDDWHDLAHRELKSIRRVYLPQLFKAYERVCRLGSESPELGATYLPVKIFLLEYCKFLTLSRAEIVGLSRGECYVFMMLIKNQLWQQLLPTGSLYRIPELQDEMDIRVEFVDPSSGHNPASSDPLHQIQPDWVVLAHQELQSLRNMYSAKLDEIHKEVFELWSQDWLSKVKYDSSRSAVERASNFLALSRAGIYDFSEEKFNESMRNFKNYVKLPQISKYQGGKLQSPRLQSEKSDLEQSMNNQGNLSLRCAASMDSSPLYQFERFPTLNDQLYDEIQLMKKKYMPVLLRLYDIVTRKRNLERVKEGIYACLKFLEMPRCFMATVTKHDYQVWVEYVKSVVAASKKCMPHEECSKIEESSFGYCEVKRNRYELD